jgi:hypothetical protein
MLTAEQLRASVNLYTGECAFPLELASLPGRNGLDVSLIARYGGNVRRQAATWNLDAPTGVLGLGWSLSQDAVVALRDGAAADPPSGYALVSPSVVRVHSGPAVAIDPLDTPIEARSAAATGERGRIRLPAAGAMLRVVTPDGDAGHTRFFLPRFRLRVVRPLGFSPGGREIWTSAGRF